MNLALADRELAISQETLGLTDNAQGTGTRRFASSTNVGRTW